MLLLLQMNSIANNIKHVTKIIEETALKCGRDPKNILLMAVSKTKPLSMLQEAYDAGMRLFGENRILEAIEKRKDFPSDAKIDFIGHLQSNKAKLSIGHFSCIQSIDTVKIAVKLDNYAKMSNSIQDILIEVNTSEENSKSGFTNDADFFNALAMIMELGNIKVKGLMTIAPFTDNENMIRNSFKRCKTLFDRSKELYPQADLSVLSMGMSNDYKIAIEEGSTLVRIGSLIFGVRK